MTAAQAAPGAATVLVIEDDPADQERLVLALTKAHYAVEVAATGAQALARCRDRTFDAVTLDLLLPDMNGVEVLQRIRADGRHHDVPVIVITIVTESGSLAGVAITDILHKPVDASRLEAALRRAGAAPDRSGSVLVVDDDESSLKLMATALRQVGYEARCARTTESALHAVEGAPPSAVVLDLMMPGMNGFEFLERFRRQPVCRRVPVIVWTVKELTAEERARLAKSAQAIVPKGGGEASLVITELQAFLPAPLAER
jgi:CheY-like chemotaxis protein